MNRLWVRISLVIAAIIIFIAFMPYVTRTVSMTFFDPPRGGGEGRFPPPPNQSEGGNPPNGDFMDAERQAEIERGAEDRALRDVYITLAVGAALGLVATAFLTRWLIAPLSQLEQGTQAVAKQRLDYRLPENGSQEMRSLARSFNHMTSQLEAQETLRRNLLADVTHELRHPVHVIQGSLQAVLDGVYPLNMEEIALMYDQTQHLAVLVDDLHALARAEAHELPLYRQPTDVGALVQELTDAIAPLTDEKELKMRVTTPTPPVVLNVDPQRLRQVVQNLLSNAIRYTPNGGTIALTVTQVGDDTRITVQDTGIGIASDELPRVFDRFYRSDASRNRAKGGAGLGLAIAKAIAEAHGGTIAVESEGLNQGSRFTVRLPVTVPV
jgi:two-component system sensor histidine kinase BaeS